MDLFAIVEKQLQWAASLGIIPYIYIDSGHSWLLPITNKNKKQWVYWNIWRYSIWGRAALLTALFVKTLLMEGHVNPELAALHIVWTLMVFANVLMFVTLTRLQREVSLFYGSIVVAMRKHEGLKASKFALFSVLGMVIGLRFGIFMLPALAIVYPCAAFFPGNLIVQQCASGNIGLSWYHYVWLYSFELSWTIPATNILISCLGLLALGTEYIILSLTGLKKQSFILGNYLIHTDVNPCAALIQKYYQLQMLTSLHNECFKNYVQLTVQFCNGSIMIVCLFGLLNFHSKVSWIGCVIFVMVFFNAYFMVSLSLHLCSTVFVQSQSLKQFWSSQRVKRKSLLHKGIRSCHVLTINAGSYHKIDRLRLTIVLRFVLQRTIFLTVAYRE